jgi:RND family efflux transporter MFP subunit
VNDDIDLSVLARSDQSVDPPPPRRRWLWVLIPTAIVIGFILIVLESSQGLFTAATPVTIVRPEAAQNSGGPSGSTVLQAAGWIEPDPFSVRVTALTSGVIEELLVQEADTLKAGDAVAMLVSEDAELGLEASRAALALAQAEQLLAQAELDYAKGAFEAALEVTEARDAARADHESRAAEVELRQAATQKALATVGVANAALETQRYLREEGAAGPWQVELAEARLQEAEAELASLKAQVLRSVAEEAQSLARKLLAEGDFDLRLEEHRRIAAAEAVLARTDATARAAEVTLAEAQLRLDRMTVRSPIDGVVLSRDAYAGSVVGPRATDQPLCHLYDPASLRVRVDVPQTQVAAASVGMRAEIRCDARRNQPYQGEVLRIVETADIQKVTLEVQVRVLDPDAHLKPDMLCQVAVLGDGSGSEGGSVSAAVRIPARCVAPDDTVWVVDGTSGRAALRSLRLGAREGDEVIVIEGLNASDKVIDRGRQGLNSGARILVENE